MLYEMVFKKKKNDISILNVSWLWSDKQLILVN